MIREAWTGPDALHSSHQSTQANTDRGLQGLRWGLAGIETRRNFWRFSHLQACHRQRSVDVMRLPTPCAQCALCAQRHCVNQSSSPATTILAFTFALGVPFPPRHRLLHTSGGTIKISSGCHSFHRFARLSLSNLFLGLGRVLADRFLPVRARDSYRGRNRSLPKSGCLFLRIESEPLLEGAL